MPEENKIYLSAPHMSGYELKYVNDAFEKNWVAPLGENVDAFEYSLAKYCSTKYAAALSSGTASIHLALIILGVKPGDEVIASSFTFSATINPIVYLGAKPVLIDSEPGTWNMDPELLEDLLEERNRRGELSRIKAILVVHLYGMPARMNEILSLAQKYEIPVIEDAAEALGSRYQRRPLGSFGKMSVLSFNGNKIITTSGGGALISDTKEIIEQAKFLATQARDKAPHYQHSAIGYNYRMSNVLAGIGRGQMEVIDKRVEQRRAINKWYRDLLKDVEGVTFQTEPSEDFFSNYWLTAISIDQRTSCTNREKLRQAFEADNIESRPLWKPMHLQPIFSKCEARKNGVSQSLFENGLCLPSASSLNSEDKMRIEITLRRELHF